VRRRMVEGPNSFFKMEERGKGWREGGRVEIKGRGKT
jgi:hypothetical protein